MVKQEDSRILSELTVQIVDGLTADMTLAEMAKFWDALDAEVKKEKELHIEFFLGMSEGVN